MVPGQWEAGATTLSLRTDGTFTVKSLPTEMVQPINDEVEPLGFDYTGTWRVRRCTASEDPCLSLDFAEGDDSSGGPLRGSLTKLYFSDPTFGGQKVYFAHGDLARGTKPLSLSRTDPRAR